MNKHLIFISICLITLSNSLCAQSLPEIQNWANQQPGEISSENVANFIKSYDSGGEITFGYQYMYSTIPTSTSLIETLTDSTFVLLYASSPNYSSYAILGTITDTVISYGPAILFNNKYATSICCLDANTILFTTVSNNESTVIVGEVTGNSITFGDEVIYSNANIAYSSISTLDNENFILSYVINYTYFDNEVFVKKGKLLGNTLQVSNSISADEGHITAVGTIALDSSNFVVFYDCDGGEARPGTIVGDSIVLGPVSAFTSGWNVWHMTGTTLCDNTFVLGYGYWANWGLGIVGKVVDNSIIFGSPVIFDSTRVEGIYATTMDNNHFVFSYCDREAGLVTTSTVVLGTVSGYDITFGDEYTSSLYTSTQRSPIATLDPNHFVIGLTDFTQSWGGGAKIGTIAPNPIISYQGSYLGDSTYFSISYVDSSQTIIWNFGDTATGINNTSTFLNPAHLFSDTGYYSVTATVTSGPDTNIYSADVQITFEPIPPVIPIGSAGIIITLLLIFGVIIKRRVG